MRLSHSDAENRYQKIRKTALEIIAAQIPSQSGIRLKLIDSIALTAAKQWRQSANRRVDWDWFEGYRDFSFRHPKRFELAIWHGKSLISLTLGRPTYHGSGLRLDFVEANPDLPRDKTMPIVLMALIGYATALGANEIRIMNPINEAVKSYYQTLGLHYVTKGDYLYKKI